MDGAHVFRRRLVTPFLTIGAASLACDHLPMNAAPGRRDAYGTVHKGNALNGARFQLENFEPFGRNMRGVSNVYVTKDRPGYLRNKGIATKVPGKTRLGTLVVDDCTEGPNFFMKVWAPKDGETAADANLAASIHKVLWDEPDHKAPSKLIIESLLRRSGEKAYTAELTRRSQTWWLRRGLRRSQGRRTPPGTRQCVPREFPPANSPDD